MAAVLCLLLPAITLLVYFPVFGYDFVNYDDPDYVYSNPHVLAGLTWHGIIWAFLVVHSFNWHPLTWISHMTDVELFGAGPAGPHVVNVLFHAANAVLVFLVLKKMSGAIWRSAFVAAFFALHPLHVESVAWISERKDVLSTFFGLLALWKYAFYVEEAKQGKSSKQSANYWWALLFFVLALLSKPMLVTLPFIMLLLDYWPLQRFKPATGASSFSSLLWLLKEKAPFLFFSAASCILTFKAQHESEAVQSLSAFPLNGRIENVFVAYAQYLGKTFLPINMACLYPHPGNWPWPEVLFDSSVVVGISAASIWLRQKWPFIFVGWFWFLGMLVPVIGLVQVGFQSMADRYTYLPLVGIFLILAWGSGEAILRMPKAAAPVCLAGVVLLVGCGVLARNQLQYWQNGGTLFHHAVATTKNNYIAYNNLGYYLFKHDKLDEAIDDYQKALQIKPDFETALENLGVALIRDKQYDGAITCYRSLLRLNPSDAAAYSNLGYAFTVTGRFDEAIDSYRKAVQIKPGLVDALVNLGGALAVKGQFEEAAVQYRKALQLSPQDAQIHFELGNMLKNLGKKQEAMDEFSEALNINPEYQEAQQALQEFDAP